MLLITIPAGESWDESREEFVVTRKEQSLQLEHSLLSISKWESKWCKPFISIKDKTAEETLDYIRCMTITQNVNPDIYTHLTDAMIKRIKAYIEAPMTATTFSKDPLTKGRGGGREVVTSELIYYWMIAQNIPMECQKWHLNRLLALIKVCNIKNQPPKNVSKRDRMSQYAKLNAARRKQYNSRG